MSIKQKNNVNIIIPNYQGLIGITIILLSSAILVQYMKVYPKTLIVCDFLSSRFVLYKVQLYDTPVKIQPIWSCIEKKCFRTGNTNCFSFEFFSSIF